MFQHTRVSWFPEIKREGISRAFRADVSPVPAKAAQRLTLGKPEKLASCHTAFVPGYLFEGHVPARDIRRFLTEHPRALDLAVSGILGQFKVV